MNYCNNKLKHNCGSKVNSRCVKYELELPSFSNIEDEGCVTIEETTYDIYQLISDLKSAIDLEGLGESCLEYGQDFKLKDVLLKIEEKLCEETEINSQIDVSTLDTKCLVDPCDVPFSTPNQLLQSLINKVCELESQLNNQ